MNTPAALRTLSVGAAILLAVGLTMADRANADEYAKSYSTKAATPWS